MSENTEHAFLLNEKAKETKKIQSFIVLDLETTGLDTETETIMEIAAIRFTIEKDRGGSYKAVNVEERSMLINPGREVTEEISMITHITGDMLVGKPSWDDVRERVSDFLRGSVIVGHNVLFDVAMLKSHGINLENEVILDTFELSELFSSDSESLNLGFLGSRYGFKTDKGEHRALGDVEICLSLFLYYLREMEKSSKEVQSILGLIGKREEKRNIGYLLEFLGLQSSHFPFFDTKKYRTSQATEEEEEENSSEGIMLVPEIVSLSGKKEEEEDLLEKMMQKYQNIHILTPGYKVSEHINNVLGEKGFTCTVGVPKNKLCSVRYIEEYITGTNLLERKLSILLGRILLWLEKSETGLLSELKMYGKEYEYADNFHMDDTEENIFSIEQRAKEKKSHIVVYTTYDYIKSIHQKPDCLIIKDIGFLDDSIRKAESFALDITEIQHLIRTGDVNLPMRETILSALSLIEHIYAEIPERPTGASEISAGGFGETYFFDQQTLWKRGGVWLLLATKILTIHLDSLKILKGQGVERERGWKKVVSSIEYLISYHTHTSSCTSIVIDIGRIGTTIRYIPQRPLDTIKHITTEGAKSSILLYGHGISGKKVSSFLEHEFHLTSRSSGTGNIEKGEIKILETLRGTQPRGSVILTTSMKHIRDIGKECEKMGIKTLMQGISGGKSKILSLFEKNIETTVLIGLIDTWRDEYALWGMAKGCIIAKLPFDPPSDPYFLARTVGMSNNFALYSEPMVIIRINTLIGHIRSAGYTGTISTLDGRLSTTVWGMGVWNELL